MTAAVAVAASAGVLGTAAQGLRWLRVAQREHYIAGSATRFAARWWSRRAGSAVLMAAGLLGAVASQWWSLASLATAAVGIVGPLGLSVRGRTSPLAWTRRLRTLTVVWAALQGGALAVGWAAGSLAGGAAFGVLGVPLLVDLACRLTSPLERVLSGRFVRVASVKLRSLDPTVVAITGSFGKTSTKVYVSHLLSGTRAVVASPASYNNRAGLARTVNENLEAGTEVLVAEMGTYGPGEIAALCEWMPPEIAVITAVGPVHLERFGSEEAILAAKSEITVRARVVVLNVDSPHLEALAKRIEVAGRTVRRCSARDTSADVCVLQHEGVLEVLRLGERLAQPATQRRPAPGNVACAVAVCLELGVAPGEIERRLETLPEVPSRLSVRRSDAGFVVIDDTYNSNPAGACAALEAASRSSRPGHRTVVVTPGMVELGSLQRKENAAFASAAAAVADDIVLVGRTNRRSLLEGLGRAPGVNVVTVGNREGAVAWVRSHLGRDDVVLYENDLPDHYA